MVLIGKAKVHPSKPNNECKTNTMFYTHLAIILAVSIFQTNSHIKPTSHSVGFGYPYFTLALRHAIHILYTKERGNGIEST